MKLSLLALLFLSVLATEGNGEEKQITACNDHTTKKRCMEQIEPPCLWDGAGVSPSCKDNNLGCRSYNLKDNCEMDGKCIYDNKTCWKKTKVKCTDLTRKANCEEMGLTDKKCVFIVGDDGGCKNP